MRMSMRPPISPATSLTERELVRSSGSSVTFGIDARRSKPGGFFQGSAYPTQTRSAPAEEQLVAVAQQRLRDQLAGAILRAPIEPMRQAGVAGLARRILHGGTVA